MGYDMHQVDPLTFTEQAAKDAAHDQCNAAVNDRAKYQRGTPEYQAAQERVEAAYDLLDTADVGYFRLNLSGMGFCRGYMYDRGMIYDAPTPMEWPAYPETGDDEADEAEYARLAAPIRAAHPEGGDTIPSFKFGSNDGWLVTPEECKAALAANALHDPPTYTGEDGQAKPVQWWPGWVAFLERGANGSGFTVH